MCPLNLIILNNLSQMRTFAHISTRKVRIGLCVLITFLVISPSFGQNNKSAPPSDSLWFIELPVMVVTATKSAIELRDVPIPTKVILGEQIRLRGGLRLSDLLSEETGFLQIHYFGSGIQLQGFDSEYTLILIDGQPVIGRNGGTLDLDRFSVSNIERVEIVQGPSSSLYGSEALAGVINLRTRSATKPLAGFASHRIQSNGTRNSNVAIESIIKGLGSRFNYDRYSSDGYDLSPDVIGLTGPSFVTHTSTARFDDTFGEKVTASLGARLAIQNQSNVIGFDQSGVELSFEERFRQKDWSLSPSFVWKFSPKHRFTFRGHLTSFDSHSELDDTTGHSVVQFNQGYQKAEVQHDLILPRGLIVNTGAGLIGEFVEADRISGGARTNQTTFAFSQQQWFPWNWLQIITSGRLDRHSDFGIHFSPKAAVMYKSAGSLRVRGSIGSGFKAPSFQQLYMDFTNAVAGYTVVGASDVAGALQNLESLGQIQAYLTDPDTFTDILPETSVAYNLSADFDLTSRIQVHISAFRNNVRDLIETLPVAAKPNGQQVFTYVNLSRIYTQGLSTEITAQPFRSIHISMGYQFLSAKDRRVLEDIDQGIVFGRQNGRDYRLSRSDYGGLFNRSKHSGTIQVAYTSPDKHTNIQIRGTIRSRYGYGDLNGNSILDAASEYVKGYLILNTSFTRDVTSRITLQAGVNNLMGYTSPQFVPSLSGRQLFAGLSIATN